MSATAPSPAIAEKDLPVTSGPVARLRLQPGSYREQSSHRFGIMLLVALFSHLLLVWQLSWPPPAEPALQPAPLQLQWQRPAPEPVLADAPEPVPATAPSASEAAVEADITETPLANSEPEAVAPEPVTRPTWELLDAPTLREQSRELLRERPGESLARPQVQPLARLRPTLPRTLTKARALPLITTPFSEVYLTGETEVIDQWETPDGGREVILRTPNGQVLCGRRAAPELLEPLVQPIMLYRAC